MFKILKDGRWLQKCIDNRRFGIIIKYYKDGGPISMAYGMAMFYSFANVKMLVPVKIPGEFFNFKYILGL